MNLLMINGSALQSGEVAAAGAPQSTNITKGDGSEISKDISGTQCVWRIFTLEEAISVLAIYFNFIKKNRSIISPSLHTQLLG